MMTDLIIKLFIKDHENTADPSVRASYGKTAGIVGIITNIILSAAKAVVGLIFGSIAVVADAVNNLTDALSSIVTLVGFHLAAKPADEKHPYGHARIEYLTGLFTALAMVLLAIELGVKSVKSIIALDGSEYSLVTVIALALAVAVKLWQWRFYSKMGKKISSGTLKATSLDSRNDAFITLSVLLCTVIAKFVSVPWLDGAIGCVLSVVILVSGIKLVIETSNPLLGTSPDPELVSYISKKVLSYSGVLGVHDLVIHSYGAGATFVSIHVEVDSRADFLHSHDLADNIESDFRKHDRINLVVHLDPIVTDDERVTDLREKTAELLSSIDTRLSFHDFRVVFGPTHTNLIFDVSVPVGVTIDDDDLRAKIKSSVKTLDAAYFAVVTVDREYLQR